jgi:ATP-dependent DNA ligase
MDGIKEALGARRVTLDGELVCLREDGHPDFRPLRLRLAGSEGVVAKRLQVPSRATGASWIKHKLRREERLAVTGIRRSPDGRTEAVFVARLMADGTIRSAGAIELGLSREILEELEQRLAELPVRRRGAVAWYPPEVWSSPRCTASPDGIVRDAILRGVDS